MVESIERIRHLYFGRLYAVVYGESLLLWFVLISFFGKEKTGIKEAF